MESKDRRDHIVLYEVPLLPELEVKSLIIKALPQAQLTLQNIILRKKDGKYQAFLEVSAQKVDQICKLKTLIINKESVTIKKPFTEAQIFIGRIPEEVTNEEILKYLESEIGKIEDKKEGHGHEKEKSKFRHIYIQFASEEDAEKCLFTPKKLTIKGFQLRPSRAYAMNENDETDKKLFLKVLSDKYDQENLERVLNEQFRKLGKLREKIRVENKMATVVYTSAAAADKAFQHFRAGKVGDYDIVVRPYANKDSYTVFVGGLNPNIDNATLEQYFSEYQPMLSCSLAPYNMSKPTRNATITFGSKQVYNRLLVEYKDNEKLKPLFVKGTPYITQHMSAKDRNEYSQFIKGKSDRPNHPPHQQPPMIPPPMMGGMPMYMNMNMAMGPYGGINIPQQPYPPMHMHNKFQQQGQFRPTDYNHPRPNPPNAPM